MKSVNKGEVTMKGITFGNLHSFRDLHLLLTSKEIGSPAVKVRKIDIEGADSALDLTDFFGEPKYEDVTHKFNFSTIVPQAQFLTWFSTVKNALHGKKLRIILDDDPLFYYLGRISVSSFTNEKNIGMISIEADCEPYKYKLNETAILQNLSGKNLFDCANPQIATAYNTEVTSLSTGVRITSKSQGQWRFAQFKIAPIKVLAGRTITLSYNATVSEGAAERVGLGYFKNPYNPIEITAYSAANSNKVSLAVDAKYAENYDYVGFWLYSSRDVDGQANSYVDYTNLQIELGSTATEYEAYDSVSKAVTITAVNGRKPTIPTVMTTTGVTIEKDGFAVSVQAGTEYRIPELELKEGDNLFAVTGSGLCLVKYQEGDL